jgi:hypothetical protein
LHTHPLHVSLRTALVAALFHMLMLLQQQALADIASIEIHSRELLGTPDSAVQYEAFEGLLHGTLDPEEPGNQKIVDLALAPRNAAGLVEFSADFRLLVPRRGPLSDTLLYQVNNRGRSSLPPDSSLQHPLSTRGYTYLSTGWISELEAGDGRLRLHAPAIGSADAPVTGMVRYEVFVNAPATEASIAGTAHLAYRPTAEGLRNATLTRRLNQADSREPVARDDFTLQVEDVADSEQVRIMLSVAGGLVPGVLYELIYEAQDPVLAGAGLAGIRDAIALLRHGTADASLRPTLETLQLPELAHTVAWGNSQSGRLLRQFLYQGFNEDLDGRRVFDGVMPVIAGGGFGMFNLRFAMPTSTNGQHEYHLFPNDYFPFTYGDSTDPFSGRIDGILRRARESGTEPLVMHVQTANEYWIRGGSLAHTDPLGSQDALIPENVRFYTLGGSAHSSGNGRPGQAGAGQLPANPNLWSPIADSLLARLVDWVRTGSAPPASRYPRLSDGSLVPSHLADGQINPQAWHPLPGVNHPKAMYQVADVDFGPRFLAQGIVDHHPVSAQRWYRALVPAIDLDNNDSATSTVLPALTAVPLGTFVPWNLRSAASGADTELLRLSGGYVPFPTDADAASSRRDPRQPLSARYADFADYLDAYAQATDALIAAGYLLPQFREQMLELAQENRALLP